MEEYFVNDFLEDLRLKGRNSATIAHYGCSLREYAEYLDRCGYASFFAATQEAASGFLMAVKEKTNEDETVYKKHLAAYRFYEWLKESGRILLNPLSKPHFSPGVRLPRRVPCKAVLERAYTKLRESPLLYEQRDYAMIDLAYSCGLRRGELHGLNVEDVSPSDGTIRVTGKLGKQRIVPIGKKALDDLLYYVYHVRPKLMRGGGKTSALFVSWIQGGKRMNPWSINAAFRRLRMKYGFDKTLVPHGLRHAFATDLLRGGAPVQDVAKMLGHVRLETTQMYTHLLSSDLKIHHKKYHPRA